MREYIQPGFAKAQTQREVDKLTAVLQALKNCHRTMNTIRGGGEEAFLAQEDIGSAFQRIDTLRQERIRQLDLPADPSAIDIELNAEFEEDSDLVLRTELKY